MAGHSSREVPGESIPSGCSSAQISGLILPRHVERDDTAEHGKFPRKQRINHRAQLPPRPGPAKGGTQHSRDNRAADKSKNPEDKVPASRIQRTSISEIDIAVSDPVNVLTWCRSSASHVRLACGASPLWAVLRHVHPVRSGRDHQDQRTKF
jgi:hypothetical protein